MKIPILTNKKSYLEAASSDNKFSKPNPRINIIIIVIYLLFAIFLRTTIAELLGNSHNFYLFHNKSSREL